MTRQIPLTSSGLAGVLLTVLSPPSVLAQSTTTSSSNPSPTFQYRVQFATDEPLACIGFTHMLTALLKLRFLAGVSGALVGDGFRTCSLPLPSTQPSVVTVGVSDLQ